MGHKAIHLCIKGGVYYLTGTLAYPIWARLNHEDISNLHAAASLGVGLSCYAVFMLDNKISESHLLKIARKLQPRADASELSLEWTFSQGEMREKMDFYQKEIYQLAKSVELRPPKRDGIWNGGHLHIDLKTAFDKDPQKFKNFVLDFWSHGELARGILAEDPLNASPIQTQRQLKQIRNLVIYLDSLTQDGKSLGPGEIRKIYKKFPRIFNKLSFLGLNSSALNLKPSLGTLEIRALRSQKNAKALALITELLDRRIQYTNSHPRDAVSTDFIRNDWTDSEKIKNFQSYVEESGLNFDEFRELVPKKYLLYAPPKKWVSTEHPCLEHFSKLNQP